MPEQRVLDATPDETRLWRRAAPLLRGHRLLLAAAGAVNLAAAAAQVGSLATLGLVTEAVLARDARAVIGGASLYGLLVLASFGLSWLGQWLLVSVGERFVRALRERALESVATSPVRFVESQQGGELVRRLTGEIAELSAFVGGTLPELVGVIVTLVLTFVMVAGYSWPLTLVLAVLVLAAGWPLVRRFLRRAGAAYAGTAAAEARVSATFSESLPAREQLVVLGAVERRLDWFDRDNKALLLARLDEVRADRVLSGLSAVRGLVLVALLLLGFAATTAGWLGVGGVVVFLAACRSAFSDIESAVAGIGEWRAAKTTLARVLDLVDAATSPPVVGATAALPRSGTLSARGLGYHYRAGLTALAEVDLDVAPGERVALVGATGSGKTTLGKLLAGLYRPDAGTVTFGGVELGRLTDIELRRRVVLVPQEVLLLRGSIADNLALLPGVEDDAAGRTAMLATAHRLGLDGWLAALPAGLNTDVGEQGRSLSAGERQLVALLRAVLADPSVLVLDEATADVDPVTAARVEDALAHAGEDRAVVVIAHRPDTVQRADRVIRLVNGRLVG